MKIKIAWGLIILVIIIIGVAAVFTYGGKEIQVTKVYQGVLTREIEEIGYVNAVDSREIQSFQTGRISEVLVKAGEMVNEGQRLLLLENLDLEREMNSVVAQLEGIEAEVKAGEIALESTRLELAITEQDIKRKEQLSKAGAISAVEYENALLYLTNIQKTLAKNDAYLKSLRSQADNLDKVYKDIHQKKQELTVTSPKAGQVLTVAVESGQMAFPGMVLARVGSPENLEIRTDIITDDLIDVEEGQKAHISGSVLGNGFLEGVVSKIYPEAHEKISALGLAQRRVTVIISLDDPQTLKPGYEVNVAIETFVKPGVILAPRESVHSKSDGSFEVLKIIHDKVEYHSIAVGEKNQEFYEVTNGLKAGDLIVHDAGSLIKEKTRVKPVLVD